MGYSFEVDLDGLTKIMADYARPSINLKKFEFGVLYFALLDSRNLRFLREGNMVSYQVSRMKNCRYRYKFFRDTLKHFSLVFQNYLYNFKNYKKSN